MKLDFDLNNNIRFRTFPESNYKAVYYKNQTMRFAINNKIPIDELEFPEFYDLSITDKCNGNCPYCYRNSDINLYHAESICQKAVNFFGKMSDNEKPFSVAIGGGEPTIHPEFTNFLKTINNLGITPNYTTNGTNLTQEIVDSSKEYCGGVAVTCHNHIDWENGFNTLYNANIPLNLHILIHDKESIDKFLEIYEQYKNKTKYFVLLPMLNQGRANGYLIDEIYLYSIFSKINMSKIALGAKFYDFAKRYNLDISIYEPEIMSKFIDMKSMQIYKSSFLL